MKKKIWIPIVIILVIIGLFLIIYPTVEIQTDNKLIAFRFQEILVLSCDIYGI